MESRISITKSYSLGFPTKFYRDNSIRIYKYLVLYYDDVEKAIGIHFSNDETEENKYAVIHSKNGYGGSAVVRSFFNTYNIDPKKYHGKYKWEKQQLEGAGGLFIIDLKEKETTNGVKAS